MSRPTRRDFLTTTTGAIAGLALGAQRAKAFGVDRSSRAVIFGSGRASDLAVAPLPDAAIMRRLASAAIEAAHAAGATYADVRVAERQQLNVDLDMNFDAMLVLHFSYGIRVLVDGQWTFTHGTAPNVDAIARAATNAVATARGEARAVHASDTTSAEMAPAPVATGEWTTPMRIDPFTVSIEEQLALLSAIAGAAGRPLGSISGFYPPWGGNNFHWIRETRVFASSEGALTTQSLYQGRHGVVGMNDRGTGAARVYVPVPLARSGGYETVLIPDLQDRAKAASEEALRLAHLPLGTIDVGRYPVVFDGYTFGALMTSTLSPALELDRALGYEADASGTSFLTPGDVLGEQLFPAALSMTADRSVPTLQAVKWDDEGVTPEPYPLIQNGRVVDFHTSRQTAPALREWYTKRGLPLKSHGCAVSPKADDPVTVRGPHISIVPSTNRASLDDLCKDVSHGLLVRQAPYIATDQQLSSGSVDWADMFVIDRGKPVRRIDIFKTGAEFSTRGLLKSLGALGDETTLRTADAQVFKGQPWVFHPGSATAPAALFKEINVVSTGRVL